MRERAAEPASDRPDARLAMRGGDGATLARCSLWWSRVPDVHGRRAGLVGHWTSSSGAAARALLARACDALGERGCELAVGPVDGSTWRRYRFATWSSGEPPFRLEPTNPPEWPAAWSDAGFEPLAEYVSTLCDDLTRTDPRDAEAASRLAASGVRIRPLDGARFGEELRRIHEVVSASFADALLYAPVSAAAMAVQYEALRPLVDPGLVLLAEREERLVGFCFCLPDAAGPVPGAPRTAIVKTLAVLPHHGRLAGLGGLLVARAHEAMRARGYARAIHALMHAHNPSLRISRRTSRPIRRYALFARRLG